MIPMRLYLSSFRMGNRTDQLLKLAGGAGHVAVIANAMDAEPADIRRTGVRRCADPARRDTTVQWR